MNNKYIDDILDEEFYDYLIEVEYPQYDRESYDSDNRYWKSYVEDIKGGDNFIDYCEYIFGILEEEGYYDW